MAWAGWNTENEADLRRMVGDGFTATEVAKRLGTSRNAALGKAYRLGLTFGSDAPSTPAAVASRLEGLSRKGFGTTKAPRAPEVRKVASSSFGPRTMDEVKARVETDVRQRESPTVVAVQAHNRPFKALKAEMCKWPLSMSVREECAADSLFCAAPTGEGQVYCDRHAARAFVAPKGPQNVGPSADRRRFNGRQFPGGGQSTRYAQ